MNGRAPPRKGENFELRAELNSEYRDRRADAIKRVIANMTVGKDVSGLFPDVLKNMQTEDLEQKKLVYLYLMNYAKTQPELVILAVNTFVKDTADQNPLIRALAIRTMSTLRAEKILSYLGDPLSRCLRDENPYVRKTAALCVAKVYELKPELCVDFGFVDVLRDLVGDGNPMVVANAVTALSDIHEASIMAAQGAAQNPSSPRDPEEEEASSPIIPAQKFIIDSATLSKLLLALNECSEWGRIAILNALAKYQATGVEESEQICERVMPQFQHSNGAVVLGAVKVIMVHMRNVEKQELITQMIRKMAPPLVTLISSPPEIQWVALRNINLLLQKRPDILANEMRVFFCKYNDPPYVKVEKLDVMVRLASERNVDTLLGELKEYASEVDVDFVRKAVKAIGQTAIKIESAAPKCVQVLLDLIQTRVSYVVQEGVVVIKDIFRKYPHSYEAVIPTLCANLDELDEPEAKASLIWIIGEYAEKIENADELLGIFLDTFKEESYAVQLQTVTAIVKLFLKKPDHAQAIVQRVLQTATKDSDNPDVRDKAYVYWRLLSTDPAAAKAVVLSVRPPISLPNTTVAPAVLDELLSEISSLASVYHKPAATFIGKGRYGVDEMSKRRADFDGADASTRKALETVAAGQKSENLLDFDTDEPSIADTSIATNTVPAGYAPSSAAVASVAASKNPLDELMDLFSNSNLQAPTSAPNLSVTSPNQASISAAAAASSPFDFDGFGGLGTASASQATSKPPTSQKPSEDLLGLF